MKSKVKNQKSNLKMQEYKEYQVKSQKSPTLIAIIF